ncbi:MAG: hypothetical protein J6B50_06305 [Lachnospiraceae bacterium]|nr:hypothetical protein [Lachnospiraceae bacterium]MBP3505625.1 hypothetical protein [Lachnospiraceae bacterium]
MKKQMKRIYQWLKRKKWIQTEGICRQLSQLYRGTQRKTEEVVEAYYIEIIQKCVVVLLLTLLFSGMLWVQEYMDAREGIHLIRADYGEEEEVYTLKYQEKDETWKEFSVVVEPVRYDSEELKLQFQQGFAYLEENMLGENTSLYDIREDMHLEGDIPDSGLSVAWSSDNPELLNDKGVVGNENLTESKCVRLQLELSYEDITESREYELTIQPKLWTEEEIRLQQIQEEVEQRLQETPYERDVYLSDNVQDVTLYNTKTQVSHGWLIFGLGVGVCILLWFRQRETIHKKIKCQKKELMLEYPFLVNQLLLYTEVGSTIQGAMERIIRQYEQRSCKRKDKKGSAKQKQLYLDLCIMWNEMHGGIGQEQAYINLGKRTGLLSYMKLTALLAQQIRKGTSGFAEQLEQEEQSAFEQRKELAKKLGEEAGTKLLFPMIMLMIISMIIVVCPALMNFVM